MANGIEKVELPWTCPGCGRGVAPGQKTCDHGGKAGLPYVPAYPLPPVIDWGCDACRLSGVCNCYRPERDSPVCIVSIGDVIAQAIF